MGKQETVGKKNLWSVRILRTVGIHLGWGILVVLGIGPSCLSTPDAQEGIVESSHGLAVANETIETDSQPADVVSTASGSPGLGSEPSIEDVTLVPTQSSYRLIADECFELSADGQPCSVTTAAASCCMATAPVSCLFCSEIAVSEHAACLQDCQEGGCCPQHRGEATRCLGCEAVR